MGRFNMMLEFRVGSRELCFIVFGISSVIDEIGRLYLPRRMKTNSVHQIIGLVFGCDKHKEIERASENPSL